MPDDALESFTIGLAICSYVLPFAWLVWAYIREKKGRPYSKAHVVRGFVGIFILVVLVGLLVPLAREQYLESQSLSKQGVRSQPDLPEL